MRPLRSAARPLRAALLALCLSLPAAAPAAAGDVLRIPVEFDVVNKNDSAAQVRCASDGEAYRVRGTLVGPRSALESSEPGVVTQYIQGFDTGWHHPFPVSGFDWGDELARRGHVSLMVDMLGYGASDRPPGNQMCVGSQADIAHQINEQLRSGHYSLDGGFDNGIRFDRVLLAGHDIGGLMVELAAYSFQAIDALMLLTWSDNFVNFAYLAPLIAAANQTCAAGGEDPDTGEPGGQYHFFGPPDERYADELFFDARDDVIDAVLQLRSRNPCGYLPSIIPTMELNTVRAREIEVPVLLVYTEDDPVIPEEGANTQPLILSGSRDVHTEIQPDSGHFPWFENNAAEYRLRVSDWLCSRGFSHPEVLCGSTTGKATGGGAIDPATGEPATDPATGEVLELALLSLAASSMSASSSSSGGRASFGFVAKLRSGDPAPHGNLRYRDHESGLDLRASSFASFAIGAGPCGPDTHATVQGLAVVDGQAGQAFRMEVDDCGEPGRSDRLELEVTGPDVSYAAEGELIGGNIQVRP